MIIQVTTKKGRALIEAYQKAGFIPPVKYRGGGYYPETVDRWYKAAIGKGYRIPRYAHKMCMIGECVGSMLSCTDVMADNKGVYSHTKEGYLDGGVKTRVNRITGYVLAGYGFIPYGVWKQYRGREGYATLIKGRGIYFHDDEVVTDDELALYGGEGRESITFHCETGHIWYVRGFLYRGRLGGRVWG